MLDYLLSTDKDWTHLIPNLDREYDEILTLIRTHFPTCFNIWEQSNPNEVCITYGKTTISDDGKVEPLEKLLTLSHENCAELCLDYIFCVRKAPRITFKEA